MTAAICIKRYHERLNQCNPIQAYGKVSRVVGFVVESIGPECRLGTVCDIATKDGRRRFPAEVMGFRDNRVLMMPLEEIRGIGPGSRVVARQPQAYLPVGHDLLGRIIDGLGDPIDGLGPLTGETTYPIYATPINPLKRKRIREPLDLGIRSINGLPTPEPAKMPTRWPQPTVSRPLMDRMPRSRGSRIRLRLSGFMGVA